MASKSPSRNEILSWMADGDPSNTAGKRAVDYLKYAWDRFCYSPSARKVVGRLSSLAPLRGRPDPNRTNLADPDLGLTHSQVDYLSRALDTPTIRDRDWRRFTDTGLVSSPSSFLGSYSRSSYDTESEMEEVTEVQSPALEVIPPSVTDSGSGIYVETESVMNHSSSHSMGASGRSRCSSQSSAATTSRQVLHRHIRSSSDPCLSTTATLDGLSKRLDDIHMTDVALCTEQEQDRDQEDRKTEQWSIVSTLPARTDSFDNDGSGSSSPEKTSARDETTSPKTPGSGTKRKSSFCMVRGNGPADYNANDSASKKRKISIRPQNSSEEEAVPTPRDHPRYSGVISMEPHWRVIRSEGGPLMVPSSPRTAWRKSDLEV